MRSSAIFFVSVVTILLYGAFVYIQTVRHREHFTPRGADAAEMVAQYGQPCAPIHVVANGVDTRSVEYATPVQRAENKRALGLSGTFIAVFMGSWHGPNIEAAESVIAAAREVPEVEFWILGSCCGALAAHPATAVATTAEASSSSAARTAR